MVKTSSKGNLLPRGGIGLAASLGHRDGIAAGLTPDPGEGDSKDPSPAVRLGEPGPDGVKLPTPLKYLS